MNETAFIIQNRLREATVSLERAGLIRCGADWACSASIPPFSSIGLILEGTGTICVDGQDLHPRAGQLYLLPAKSSQSFSTDLVHPYRKYFCHFELTCQNEELFDLIRMPLCTDAKDSAYAEKLFVQMQEVCQGSDIFSALKSKQLLLELVCCYMESCPPGTVSLIEHSFDSPLSDAVAYVEEHLNENVTVRQMAEAAGYHASHFTALFRQHLGISPGQFILRKKTDRAAELLTATSMPVSAIAEALGFASQFYFSNFFKKQTGMTPSQYRAVYMREHL